MKGYRVNIGLEVHVELQTKSKLFCNCATCFGAPPNTQVCPVCLGLPGVLPVINAKAVEFTISTALALGCQINSFCRFARKNYYYPDLPKNYQISQYDKPLAENGWVEIKVKESVRRIAIQRIHLEEDAGKLIHGDASENTQERNLSLVDYNRTGIPLMEIVSHPRITSPEEAYQYLITLKRILQYLKVSDCNMEEGSLRCDANISIRAGTEMGTKTELKNMNSFKEIRDGLTAEIKRQSYVLNEGGKIIQETRLWDSKRNATFSMRGKEEAHDYRYLPEPDLLPLKVSQEWLEKLRSQLPELPSSRHQKFVEEYGLPEYDADVLTDSPELADFFEKCLKYYPYPKIVSNWVMGEFLRLLKKEVTFINQVKVTPAALAALLKEIKKATVSIGLAKEIFEEMFLTGKQAPEIIEQKGLKQISDQDSLRSIIDQVIEKNPRAVSDFLAGKQQALGALIGQTMTMTQGRANPQLVNQLLRERLDSK